MCVFGTRPEAIKMAPVIRALRDARETEVTVCVTGQHRGMLDQMLRFFQIEPDYDLDVMRPGQSLVEVTAAVLSGVSSVLSESEPDVVLVQGDTTTTMAAALAAYYQRIPVGHIEAGLRTGDPYAPWPEEINRRLTSTMAHVHFAPTTAARDNLTREGVDPGRVVVTGNTVVDSLVWTRDRVLGDQALKAGFDRTFAFLNGEKRLVLVTGHRRESFGSGFENICEALLEIAGRGDVEVLYPVHLNPNVRGPVHERLSDHSAIHLIEPVDYPAFVYLMERSYLILTDSGGIQEEAPSLGKPVLVMRDVTERPEAVQSGAVEVVGTDPRRIVTAVGHLLNDPDRYRRMSTAGNPFGDGAAAGRIVAALLHQVVRPT